MADGQPEVALVRNLPTGDVYSAVRGRGATSRGTAAPGPRRGPTAVTAIVAANARPPDSFRPRQFRCTGSTALDIVSVACGGFDGSVDFDAGDDRLCGDYLAATLIVEEAGGVCADALGRPLVTLDPAERRRPVVASSSGLLDELLAVG